MGAHAMTVKEIAGRLSKAQKKTLLILDKAQWTLTIPRYLNEMVRMDLVTITDRRFWWDVRITNDGLAVRRELEGKDD